MQKIKVLIVDDERLARVKLVTILSDFKNIEIVGEADSVDDALSKIKKLNPDILFLDIQMPGKSGFDLINQIDFKGKIIFVTAFDRYAIRAFEVNALDYLLKPVNKERLKQTLDRYISNTPYEYYKDKKLDKEDLLFLLIGNKMQFLKVSHILYIISAVDYTKVFLLKGKEGLVSKPMREWEERLPDKIFCRIHRSTIVNTEYVEKIEKWFNNSYRVYVKDVPDPFVMSKRFASKIKNKMG
ncbi:LytR/AlgR family response regulator transcription factor [Bacteroidota bacterium]